MTKKTAIINIKVDEELKKAFMGICRNNDQNSSQVLRAAIRKYIIENNQKDVWGKK